MDEQEFLLQIEALTPRLYRICRTILRSEADCQDAAQNAVFLAWRHLPSLKNDALFSRWLIRIAINECRKIHRKRPQTLPLEDHAPAPEDHKQFFEMLHGLDEKFRIPVMLHYGEGYRISDIASILHLPEGTVKRRLHTARKLLKEEWL
ncbi:MAG: sigma-70 family RNA polymerase sigma factor [Clostridia bacterium]|nr:sigma-70 family RNA polymerase sigma factor [Clostridia bacterium]MBQ6805268.1 sigma-70 family RNA polymerase sigma factor [Clostridia bacterium]